MSLMTGPAVSSVVDRAYGNDHHAPYAARGFVRRQFRIWGVSHLAETAELVVSELVSNAYMHGRGVFIGVRLECADGSVKVSVMDEARNVPPRVPDSSADALEVSGRGLTLVSALSERWGWYPMPDGKHKVVCALITKPAL